MAKQQLQTRQTQIQSSNANGHQTEATLTVDDNCLPSPQELEQYKAIDPKIIDFLMDTTRKEQAFRHSIEQKKAKVFNLAGRREFRINWWGMFFSALIMISGIGLSAFLIYYNKTVVGTLFGGGTIVLAASVFLQRNKNK